MRVFAGPNGSGKSTIINSVRKYEVNGIPIDFGIYINADLIHQGLLKRPLDFKNYTLEITEEDFLAIAMVSGLINESFTENDFKDTYEFKGNSVKLKNQNFGDRLAQIIADFLRKKLLQEKKKFSFETVFSHPSKIEIMKEAAKQGYKVYLYFVSTEDPEINKYRVKDVRVKEGGHDVPEDKIVSRYYRSLELMYDAAQVCYQAYFFDNSEEGKDSRQVAHFKVIGGKKSWDEFDQELKVPNWFIKYYSEKVQKV
ncbi:hypothetical protein [Roseivirga pacifica]|uniref:hypothetical protein n=1 Tax=Roseivirga pacifica TaxID=1267423 RepID=UPI00227C0A3A|nr:hypothetical protein [Roseivirga pacifica]